MKQSIRDAKEKKIREKIIAERGKQSTQTSKKPPVEKKNTSKLAEADRSGLNNSTSTNQKTLDQEVAEILGEESESESFASEIEDGRESPVIEKYFPFVKVVDQKRPVDTQVRTSIKTKETFEKTDKYVLVDPKKDKHYNQYLHTGLDKAQTRHKFGDDK